MSIKPDVMDLASSNTNIQRRWLVFYTFPRAEKKCEIRLKERNIDVFLPKCRVVRQWSDRKKTITEPLFRNYIFAQVDEQERVQVLKTEGIARSVVFGRHMAEMTLQEIDQLKISQNDPNRLSILERWLPPVGAQVTVTQGPFMGLNGEVLEHRGQIYVVVRIATLRQIIKVNVPADCVQTI